MKVSTIGRHNARFREVRKALKSGALTSDGWLPVEGPHLMDEAVRSGLEIGEIFARDDAEVASDVYQVYRVGAARFDQLGATRHPQGVIALVRPPRFRVDQILEGRGPILVLCGLQDPGNVGTIVRLGEAFGSPGCIALDPTADFYNSKVVRASAGSLFRFPHVRVPDLAALQSLSGSMALVGTAPVSPVTIEDWDWHRPTAVLFGNEGQGLSETERNACEMILSIPCPGRVESLNTASAAAIVLYAASRLKQIEEGRNDS